MTQESSDKSDNDQTASGPPPPLADEYLHWMIGEWEGFSDSPMGTSRDWMKCEMGLNEQFLLIRYRSDLSDGTKYTGMGSMTLNRDGEIVGHWIDSWRTMARGRGTRVGSIVTMEWDDDSGKQLRIIEMVGDDERKEVIRMVGPDGGMIEASSKMTRVRSR